MTANLTGTATRPTATHPIATQRLATHPPSAAGRGHGTASTLVPLERVEAELCTLAGQIAAATCRFLTLLADFDAREGWAGWNVRSCAHWLSWRCGMDLRTAREHVRVARALGGLPLTRDAFAEGRLSYSKVRAVARVATTETEADLVDAALHAPAAHLERLTRGIATARRNETDEVAGREDPAGRRLRVRWRWDEDGSLALWGRLSAEDGARLLAGLARADDERRHRGAADHAADDAGSSGREGAEGSGRDDAQDVVPDGSAEPSSGESGEVGTARRRPDVVGRASGDVAAALVTMAEAVCAASRSADGPVYAPTADVVVHVSARTLVTGDEDADEDALPVAAAATRLDDGPALSAACAQRLACDGRVRLAVHASDGRTLDVGRWRRRPTAAQKTALWHRDRGCAVPGCGRTRFLHAHHVTPWSRGGHTSMDNLVLLCGEHHRALHDGAFSITALGRQRFRFHGPGGAVYPAAPASRGTAAALVAEHPDVRAGSLEPAWDGTPLDLHGAVPAYLTGWALELRWRDLMRKQEEELAAGSGEPDQRRSDEAA